MPKRRRRPAGGSGGGGGAPAAAAALEGAAIGPAPREAPEYRPAEWLRRSLSVWEALEMNRLLREARRYGVDELSRADFELLREFMARDAGEALRRAASASREERELWEQIAARRLEDLRRLDPGAAGALADEARASLPRHEQEDVRHRPGWESRLSQPLSRAGGEVRRFRELWERWDAWRRGEGARPLDPDEMGELHEYLQRRLARPLRAARRAASGEELAAARSELLDRWRQLELFASHAFPRSWVDRHARLRAAVSEALAGARQPGSSGGLHPEAESLEQTRRQAMAAASGSTDLADLERAYAEFARAREAAEAAAERYRSAGAALPGELERALNLAAEWDARFRQELDRRRARNG